MFNFFYQNSPIKKGLSVALILTIIFSASGWVLFYPKPVQALGVPDIIGGPLAAVRLAWDKTAAARQMIIDKYNSAANWVSAKLQLSEQAKEMIAQAKKIAGQIIMHKILSMLTNQIITWIQGGGKPQFISDFGGFVSDAADQAGGIFVEQFLGAGYLCEPFDIDIKIALLDVQTFPMEAQCTLSDMGKNIENFYNDFSQGGWTEWIALTSPQNNVYGAYAAAVKEKMKKEDKAREAALSEVTTGKGFLSIKECVKGYVIGATGSTCNDKNTCESLKSAYGANFVCENEITVTPASVISDVASNVVYQPIKILEDQIASMASEMGVLGPYIIAIGNALTNRVIKEGLAYVQTQGPTASDPSTPVPTGSQIPAVSQTPTVAASDKATAESLLTQQKLLNDNLKTELLTQQQSNLGVLQSIKSVRTSLLSFLQTNPCSSQSISSVTAQINTIDSQITTIQNDISTTNQWIADTNAAINSTNSYITASNDYLNYYQQTSQPPTSGEQTTLNQKTSTMTTALNSTITNGKKAAKSTATSVTNLNTDTQTTSMSVIQQADGYLQTRGYSQSYPQPGTLYDQLNQATSDLSTCQNESMSP